MGEPRWLDEREAHVWRAFLALQRELTGALERGLVRDSGLSNADYSLLVPLSEAPDGLLRARELGMRVGWERSRLSHQVKRMEKRGLVVREECAEDARGSMVRLTPAGRAAIGAAAPGHVDSVRRYLFDVLSREELDVLGRAFDRVLARIAADDDEADPTR
ncbi:MarR family winged helix-turn-helix transcriptional regulator [Saccharothrix coeruleofusca]|uniref:MarR family transcriptional regulator n=1 Tax=Saccharothrix coeruleofusca TaxID=33919 RepID=A0A918AN17_9PSEU|nr:MarR family transcriptional regulator [Saccharothrix coeruleofusca]MBP2336270.1 DNA-binding MarR family transcriptional regulator [Saccharothrix coeruleofusca]GGP54224.1 MarR family transcriptional regulator [Saccharothrix coeruleofusca]